MNVKTFLLLDSINCTLSDSTEWAINMHIEPVETRDYYNTIEKFMLPAGIWVAVYEKIDEEFPFAELRKPDYTFNLCGEQSRVLLYNVE